MLIATSCQDGVREGCTDWDASAVISITSNAHYVPSVSRRPQLVLEFRDILVSRSGRHYGPHPEHIEIALEFLKRFAPARLVVNCAAGLGRSPAMAIVALIAVGYSPREACEAVYKLVPEASPNLRVIDLGGISLGYGEEAGDFCLEMFEQKREIHGAVGNPTGLRVQTAWSSASEKRAAGWWASDMMSERPSRP